MTNAMAILLTNDDGVDAPGLAALAEALAGLDELAVSAPASNKSGVGMSITLGRDIKVVKQPDGPGGIPRYSVDGTPADAVKYGLQHLLRGKEPRLVVSGINLGPNLGINVRCSGTVGAAFEAVIAGIPALAVSVDYVIPTNWEGAKHYARLIAEKALAMADAGRYGAFLLNLNVPSKQPEEIPGIIATRHGSGGILDIMTPQGDGENYRHTGQWVEMPPETGCDMAAFGAGHAVLTPLQIDMTNHGMLADLLDGWKGEVKPATTVPR